MQHAKSENKKVVSVEPHLLFISLDLMEVLKVVIYLKYWWQAQFYNKKRFTFTFICRHNWQQAVHTKIKCINMWHHSFKNIHFHYIFLSFTTHTKIIQKSQHQIRRVYCARVICATGHFVMCMHHFMVPLHLHAHNKMVHARNIFILPDKHRQCGCCFQFEHEVKKKKKILQANCHQRLENKKNVIWFENKCMDENIAISTFYKHFKMRKNTETAYHTF